MKSHLLALAIVAALVLPLSVQAAKFTYHGQMMDGAQPANGLYDLKVRAYTSADRSKALGLATELPGVRFRNGEFSVELDLPQGPDGSTYIDVAVRAKATGGAYEALGAPQLVTNGVGACPGAWALDGNIGLPAGSFLGIADAASTEPLVLRTRNVQSLRLEPSSVLFGGAPNTANVIAGSSTNNVDAGVRGATISGGGSPEGDSEPEVIAEAPNRVSSHYATVGGGLGNRAGKPGTPILGALATVAGGYLNLAEGQVATVGGGTQNIASGILATISGGSSNCAGGDNSWAGGTRAKIRPGNQTGDGTCVANSGDADGDNGTFVWADSRFADFVSTGPDQFLVRAQGGVGINGTPPNGDTEFSVFGVADDAFGGFVEFRLTPTPALNGNTGEGIEFGVGPGGAGPNDASFRIAHRNNNGAYAERMNLNSDGSVVIRSNIIGANTGVTMAANAGAWSSLSDRRLKQGIVPVDARAILDQVVRLPMATWSYIAQGSGVRHIGPMAQDFAASFKVGENDTTISTIDADGVALAAIQGMNAKLESENAALRADGAALRADGAAMQAKFNADLAAVLARLERVESKQAR